MIDKLLILLGLKLKPLPPLKQPRNRCGQYVKFNRTLERAKLIREGK